MCRFETSRVFFKNTVERSEIERISLFWPSLTVDSKLNHHSSASTTLLESLMSDTCIFGRD
jgi:hypothetical protein